MNKLRFLFIVSFISLGLAAVTPARTARIEVVSTESTRGSYESALTIEEDGTLHVAWRDYSDYAGSDLYPDIFYKKKPGGGSWSLTEVVSTDLPSSEHLPSMGVDGAGTVHMVWHDSIDLAGSRDALNIVYTHKVSGGSWSFPEIISTESATSSSWYASLAVEPDGTVHVAWEDHADYAGSGADGDIFYKQKPGGGSWSTTEVVSGDSTGDSSNPSLAVDPDGTVHVAWEDQTDYAGAGGDWDIFYKKKLFGGSWSLTEVVSTESVVASMESSLAVGPYGAVHVAWQDLTDYAGSGSDWDIFYKKKPAEVWQPAGIEGGWSTTEIVTTESFGFPSSRPSLAVGPFGTVHVAWMELTNYAGSGDDADIFYKRKSPGDSWSLTMLICNRSSARSENPALAVDNEGMVHIVWEDVTDYAGCGDDSDIFYKSKKEVGTSTGSWLEEFPVEK
jgi:hypothetical protein